MWKITFFGLKSEIGSEFEEPGVTPPSRIPRSTPPPPPPPGICCRDKVKSILGDPGADSEDEGKSKRVEKCDALCFSGTNQKPEWRLPFGTGLVRHCPQGLFSPFFTFIYLYFRPFRISLVPTICPWVSEDESSPAQAR